MSAAQKEAPYAGWSSTAPKIAGLYAYRWSYDGGATWKNERKVTLYHRGRSKGSVLWANASWLGAGPCPVSRLVSGAGVFTEFKLEKESDE